MPEPPPTLFVWDANAIIIWQLTEIEMDVPPIAHAVVTSIDPDNYAVNVMILGFGGGQMPSLPVRVASHGPRDGVRGNFPELPQIGNWGIVAFPRGDIRNGVWMGTFEPASVDASPNQAGKVSPSYHAHYSGGWSIHQPDGTAAMVLADGTSLLAGAMLPVPTRHTIDGQQKRQATPFTHAERVPSPPGAFPLTLTHPSGATVHMSAGGGMTVNAASGQGITIVADGVTIAIVGGVVTITGALTTTQGITAGLGGGDSVTLQHHTHPSVGAPPTPGT